MSDNWPTETAIDNTGLNGEVDAPTYSIGSVLYRVNPVGEYALYFGGRGRGWRESACVTNEMLNSGELK
jgi:hypothetical protein